MRLVGVVARNLETGGMNLNLADDQDVDYI